MLGPRQIFINKMKDKLDLLDAKISVMEAKTDKTKAEAKAEINNKINELKVKRLEAQKKLDEIRNSTDDAWESLKEGKENAYEDLNKFVTNAASKIK